MHRLDLFGTPASISRCACPSPSISCCCCDASSGSSLPGVRACRAMKNNTQECELVDNTNEILIVSWLGMTIRCVWHVSISSLVVRLRVWGPAGAAAGAAVGTAIPARVLQFPCAVTIFILRIFTFVCSASSLLLTILGHK